MCWIRPFRLQLLQRCHGSAVEAAADVVGRVWQLLGVAADVRRQVDRVWEFVQWFCKNQTVL